MSHSSDIKKLLGFLFRKRGEN